MRVHSLGSGSSGNSFLVSTITTAVLIDAGVAIRACQTAVRQILDGRPLDAIVISHEHIDHVRALSSLTRRDALPVVTTEGTRRAIGQERGWTRAIAGGRFATGDIEIEFVGVSHDAAEPCGFVDLPRWRTHRDLHRSGACWTAGVGGCRERRRGRA